MENPAVPIKHLSYSALRCYLSNQQQFFKNYILGIWDNKMSPSATVGKSVHKALEQYYKTKDKNSSIEVGMAFLSTSKDSEIDYGKTGSREQMNKDYIQAVNNFFAEEPDFGTILATEQSVTTDVGFETEIFPLPVKAVTDLVSEKDGKLLMWDYKVVTSFTDKEEEQPDYIVQALFNFLTIKAKHGKVPYSMTFVEIKKSMNRNGDSQLGFYEVIFEKHLEYCTYFGKLYSGFIRNVSNPSYSYLPNISDMYSGKEAWTDFAAQTINFEDIPKVSHQSALHTPIRDVKYVESKADTDMTLTKEEKVKAKLMEFGIGVSMESTFEGANVTLYTLKPSRGVKMSRFSELSPDLSLALEAKSVRVQAPIPGTSLVGVEVSNSEQKVVPFHKGLLQPGTLMIPVGQDVYGHDRLFDLAKAPHLLIGGATGSGKSVFMDTTIHTLMKQMDPKDLQLVLVDPKRTEFSDYDGDAHLPVPVITEVLDVDTTMEWAVGEMENRYKKLKSVGVKSIADYRNNATDMPYVVIIVDELSDIMLSPLKKKIDDDGKMKTVSLSESIQKNIIRLAQKARAVGIHLILATQRPSIDVVTGLIKANFPARISFMVSSGIDSRVILDDIGAEKLIGNGDLLLVDPRKQGSERLQGYFLKK